MVGLGNSYTYDNNGNTISRTDGTDTDTYTYNFENRLTSANIQLGPTPGPVSYTYDADGIRTNKTDGGTTTSFLVDKNRPFAQVLVETTGANTVSFVHGDDLISMKRPTGTSYYLFDGQMSTRQLTNSAQTVTDTYTYDAFGIELYHTGTTVNNYKYTGEQHDANVGFYYLRARYYNQGIGRFVTIDTHQGLEYDPRSLHKYVYGANDPVNMMDPSGHFLIAIVISLTILSILATLAHPVYALGMGKIPGKLVREAIKLHRDDIGFVTMFRTNPIPFEAALLDKDGNPMVGVSLSESVQIVGSSIPFRTALQALLFWTGLAGRGSTVTGPGGKYTDTCMIVVPGSAPTSTIIVVEQILTARVLGGTYKGKNTVLITYSTWTDSYPITLVRQ